MNEIETMHQSELISRYPTDLPEGFGYWLAGFIDGEGHFGLRAVERIHRIQGKAYFTHECSVGLQIALRDDDTAVLEYIYNTLKCGTMITRKYKKETRSKPTREWRVRKAEDLKFVIVPLLERYPLKSKKAREFDLWKQAVNILFSSKMMRRSKGKPRSGYRLSEETWAELKKLQSEVVSIRVYKPKEKGNE